MLGVPAASSAPLWVLDSIALTDLVTPGREATPDWVPQNGRDSPRWIPHEGVFQNQVQTEPLLRFLNQNVIVVTYVAMPAGCGLVNDVCYSRGVLYMRYFDKQPNKGLPQVNDVLTPRACQALLTYIYIILLGKECTRRHNVFVDDDEWCRSWSPPVQASPCTRKL